MQILRQGVKHPFDRAVAAPPLKPAMARLVGRVSLTRKVFPARSAAKDPQNAVQDISRISPRAPATVLALALAAREIRRDELDPALLEKALVQAVAVGGLVSDQPMDRVGNERVVESLFDERDLVRRSTCDANGDWKTQCASGPLVKMATSSTHRFF